MELEKNSLARPSTINLTFSIRWGSIKNYFLISLRGEMGSTKEERKLKYQIIKRAAKRRVKKMKTLFLNVKTKEKMEDCANSWGHCAEVVSLREENSWRHATLYSRTIDLIGEIIPPCLHYQTIIVSTHLAIIHPW